MLYEEIILGSLKRPQAFFLLYDFETGGTCAMGSIFDARGKLIGGYGHGISYEVLRSEYPFLRDLARCPECGGTGLFHGDVIGAIVHLNNIHRWTRERIALDFLRPRELAFIAEKEREEEEKKAAVEAGAGVEVEA